MITAIEAKRRSKTPDMKEIEIAIERSIKNHATSAVVDYVTDEQREYLEKYGYKVGENYIAEGDSWDDCWSMCIIDWS